MTIGLALACFFTILLFFCPRFAFVSRSMMALTPASLAGVLLLCRNYPRSARRWLFLVAALNLILPAHHVVMSCNYSGSQGELVIASAASVIARTRRVRSNLLFRRNVSGNPFLNDGLLRFARNDTGVVTFFVSFSGYRTVTEHEKPLQKVYSFLSGI